MELTEEKTFKVKKKNLYSDPDAVQKASETQHWLTVMDTVQHTA